MATEKTDQPPKTRSRKRILLWLLAVLLLLVVFVLVALPMIVSSRPVEALVLRKINAATGGSADFADLSFGWFKGVAVRDFAFKDSAGRVSLNIKQIKTKPRYLSLIAGRISLTKTIIEQPAVTINEEKQAPAPAVPTQPSAPAPQKTKQILLPIEQLDLTVHQGVVEVVDANGDSTKLSAINCHLQLWEYGKTGTFDAQMDLHGANIALTGSYELAPQPSLNLKNLRQVSLSFKLEQLMLSNLSALLAAAGVDAKANGIVSANGVCFVKDGKLRQCHGRLVAKNLRLTCPAFKGDTLAVRELDIYVPSADADKGVEIGWLQVKSNWLNGRIEGLVPLSFGALQEFMTPGSAYALKGNIRCDVPAAISEMPHLLTPRENTEITSGTLTLDVKTVQSEGTKLLSAEAVLADLAGSLGERKLALSEPITAEVLITSDQAGNLRFQNLNVSSSFAKVQCTGTAERLSYQQQIDLAALQSELGKFFPMDTLQLAGRYTGKGSVAIDPQKIALKGTAQFRDFLLKPADAPILSEPHADADFSLAYQRNTKVLDINTLNLASTTGSITVSKSLVSLAEGKCPDMSLRVDANNVNLSRVVSYAVLCGYLPPDTQLAGIARSQLMLTTEDNLYRIRSDSTHVENFRYARTRPFEQEHLSAALDIRLDPATNDASGSLQLQSPQIIADANFQRKTIADTTSLTARAQLEYDWQTLAALLADYLPPDLTLKGRRKDQVSFSSEYPADDPNGLLANLHAEGAVGFEEASFRGLNFGPTEVPIKVDAGLLKIGPFTSTVNQGVLQFAAHARLNEKPVMLTLPEPMQIADDVHIGDALGRELLSYLNPVFANFSKISGVVDFNCTELRIPLGKGVLDDLVVAGTIAMDSFRVEGAPVLAALFAVFRSGVPAQDFRLHPTQFDLRNNTVSYDDMQIDIGDNPLNFQAVIGLDRSIKTMTVTLPYTTSGQTVRVGSDYQGKRISIPIRGTLTNPRLDTGKLLQQQLTETLQQQLKKRLGERLDELFK